MWQLRSSRGRRSRTGVLVVLGSVFVLAVSACSSNGASTTTAAPTTTVAPTTTAATTATTAAGSTTTTAASTGVLEPLADGFPNRRITLWNAFNPGHTDDLFNKVVAPIASKYSPVPIITDSHPSSPVLQYGLVKYLRGLPGGTEGYQDYAVAYFGVTLRLFTVAALADASLSDLLPINSMEEAPFVLITSLDSPFNSLDDVAAYAKANPGKLAVVGGSAGSGLHSTLLVWAKQAGVDFRFIPTDGAGQSESVIAGGGAQFGCVTFHTGMEKSVKILAFTGDKHVSTLPDIPTTSELGLTIPSSSFRGYGTLPEVPTSHVEWLNQLFQRVEADPDFAKGQAGFVINYRGPAETEQLRHTIVDQFIPALQAAGLTLNNS